MRDFWFCRVLTIIVSTWHRWTRVALLALSAAGLVACVGAPVQEMSNARQAIKAARDAGAERVAPQTLSEAQLLLEQAEGSLQKGAYRDARRNAIAAHHKAAEALQTVQPRPSQLHPNRSNSSNPSRHCKDCEPDASVLAAR